MTTRAFVYEVRLYIERMRDEGRRRLEQAWLTGFLMRLAYAGQKYPSMQEWIGIRQTSAQTRDMWHHDAERIGLKVKKHKPRRVRIVRVH